ncbi:ATP-binding protein [Cystobacter fuscus]
MAPARSCPEGGSLRQALLNLVLHAVLSLPDDGEDPESHEVRLVTRDDGQGHVVIEVQDTGPGLAPELLPHVFEPLFPTGDGRSRGRRSPCAATSCASSAGTSR